MEKNNSMFHIFLATLTVSLYNLRQPKTLTFRKFVTVDCNRHFVGSVSSPVGVCHSLYSPLVGSWNVWEVTYCNQVIVRIGRRLLVRCELTFQNIQLSQANAICIYLQYFDHFDIM